MNEIQVYVCEDSIEGIFTAIYDAWASKRGHVNNKIQLEHNTEIALFCSYLSVKPDLEKAEKVTRSIKQKIGLEAYRYIYYMALSNRDDKADAIYRFMILGFHYGSQVMDHLSNDAVNLMAKTYKRVSMERHRYTGFVRFEELSNHILVSKIRPENNILPILAPHFVDRFSSENFMIIDESRQMAVVHPARKQWFILSMELMDQNVLEEVSEREKEMKGAWATFVEHISIKEREHLKLQQNMCPLRYREFMPEFKKE